MKIVVIQLRAAAAFTANDRGAVLVLYALESPARFHTLQNASQPLFDPMLRSNLSSRFVQIRVGGIQKTEPIGLLGLRDQRRVHNLLGYASNIGLEVLSPNAILAKEDVHPIREIEVLKSPFENEAIEALQNTGDEQSKAL